MSDLAAAARILGALAAAIDAADSWVDAHHCDVGALAAELVSAVATSSAADDRTIAAALLDAARRELAVPEITCPACSATIRARLADQPGVLTETETRPMTDNCGLGHDTERITCEDAARVIIANRGNPHRLRDAAEYALRLLDAERQQREPRVWPPTGTLAEADLPRVYELCAQVCESESATVAGHFLGQLRDLLGPPAPQPRVWLQGDEVPADVVVCTLDGLHAGPSPMGPWQTDTPVVEILQPPPTRGLAAVVAAEQARRAATAGEVTE